LSTSYSPVIFPKWRKHSLISIENKSVEISKSIPSCTEEIAIKALLRASKCREFVTIVSLLLKAPILTKEVNSDFNFSIPVLFFAESKIKFSILDCRVVVSRAERVSILFPITNTRLFGKRVLMISISAKNCFYFQQICLHQLKK